MAKRQLTTSAGIPVADNQNALIGGDADRYDHREGNDDYTQAGNLYRLMPADERARLHKAIAGSMHGVPKEIVERQLAHFQKADPAYAKGVRGALGW